MIDRTRMADSGNAGPNPNRRQPRRLPFALFLLAAFFIAGPPTAHAQLSNDLRTSPDITPQQKLEIKTYVDGLTDKLVSGLTAKLATSNPHVAREDLIHNVSEPAGAGTLSGSFLSEYAASVDVALNKALDANPSDAVRLNLAIVAARVAEKAGNARLRPMTERLLADHSEAVVLWGLKAAQGILPNFLSVPALAQNNKLIDAIIVATQRFPNDGDIARTAYVALSPPQGFLTNEEFNDVALYTIPALHKLLESRLEAYKSGIPSDPTAELTAVNYLVDQTHWRLETADQQTKTTQLLLDLVVGVAQRVSTAGDDDRDLLIDILQKCAGALEVAAGETSPDLATAVGPALDALHAVSSRTSQQDLIDKTNAAVKALVDKMPQLKAPPALVVPTTGPATQPAATLPG
jgi:hypothetical protein